MSNLLEKISKKNPLLYFSLVGGLFIITGLISGIWVVLSYNNSNILAVGWALITILLVILGMLCIFTGMILNVLARPLD